MKIVRYRGSDGERTGLVVGDGVVDASARVAELDDLAFAVTDAGRARLAELASVPPDAALAAVTLLRPLARGARIFCVGKNFRDHAAETGKPVPPEPSIFTRTHESVVAPGEDVVLPKASDMFDYEGEMAVVIGTPGAHVAAADGLAHVGAFTVFQDGSIRDYQQHTTTAGKNFDRTGAIGPWLVTADEVGDPDDIQLTTTINGEKVQSARIGDMVYSIGRVIEYLSDITTLLPGDVISMGTPAGVARSWDPPKWLRPGHRVDVEVARVGTLSMGVR